MPARLTTEIWLARVLDRHPENSKKFDYSHVNYEKSSKKVKIGCLTSPEHGFFEQRPNDHLRGKGCPKCAPNAKKTTETWLAKVFERFPDNEDWYDYSHVNYETTKKKVKIGCLRNPEHGFFEHTPNTHLRGDGCPKCAEISRRDKLRSSKGEWLVKVLDRHPENADKYDYSQVVYKNNKKKVKIGCLRNPEHGFFEQTPTKHLIGKGCPDCADHGFSPEKSAYYYVHKLMKDGKFLCYKAGISYDWKARLDILNSRSPPEYNFEPVEQVYYEKGEEAWEFEKEMKKKKDIRAPVLDIHGGTELFLENPLGTIINLCQT